MLIYTTFDQQRLALVLLSFFSCANASKGLIRMLNILLATALISERSLALINMALPRGEIGISVQGDGAGEVMGSTEGPSVCPSVCAAVESPGRWDQLRFKVAADIQLSRLH